MKISRAVTRRLLEPTHMLLLWWSTLLALCSLAPITGLISGAVSLFVFIAATKWCPQHWWTPIGRVGLFAFLLVLIVLQSNGLSKDMGTNILMATMIVKFAEMKTFRDGSMMVLFNTAAPFVAFLQEQTPIVLLAGLLALFLTLSTARSMTEQSQLPIRRHAAHVFSVVLGNALLFAPVALAAYMLIPRMDNPLWGGMASARARTGVGEDMNIARWTTLFNDVSTAFRVRFDGPVPPPNQMYFRGPVLWSFDGEVWSAPPAHKDAVSTTNIPHGDPSRKPVYSYAVSYESRSQRAFVLDFPTQLPANVFSTSDDQFMFRRLPQGPVYWTSAPARFSELTPNQRSSALQLPPNKNPKTVALAQKWRQQFPDDQAFVQHALAFFRQDFVYSLSPPPVRPTQAVDDFVFATKTGFCAHYSSAFAVLMRAGGVPTRVVNGYAGAELSELGDYYRIRQADAHAWVEVWLNNTWVRLDPTAQVSSQRTQNGLRWEWLNRSHDVADWMKDAWSSWVLYYDEAAQEKVFERVKKEVASVARWRVRGPYVATACATLAALCVGVFWARHRRRPARHLIDQVNVWFEQWGVSWPVGTDWTEKEHSIAFMLTEKQHNVVRHALEQARMCLYQDKPLSHASILRTLRSVRPRRNSQWWRLW